MKRILLTFLTLASVAFAQTKSVSPTGGGLNPTDNPAFLSALGGTTVGKNIFALSNPSAITFLRINADNTVSLLSNSSFVSAIGAEPQLTNSSSLASTLSDETGSGVAVFGTSPTLATPIINLGSDATGDIYYRNSGGAFTRLPIGTSGQLLTVSGSSIPNWSTLTIPSVEVTLAGSETLTNKTLSTGTILSSPPTMSLGSDATGDVYYRNAGGLLTRLPAGTNGHVLTLSSGVPSWAAAAAGGLTNFTESLVTAAPHATVPLITLAATNAATNVDVVIQPKGTGGIAVDQGGVGDIDVNGNKRGTSAMDFQTLRNDRTQIASGNYSFIAGGTNNIAAGEKSFATGWYNIASGASASVLFGYANTASALYSAAGGYQNTASGQKSIAFGGIGNTVSGENAASIGGEYNQNAGKNSVTFGKGTSSRGAYGAVFQSGNSVSMYGDNQNGKYSYTTYTDSATPRELFFGNQVGATTTRMTLPNNHVFQYSGYIVAVKNPGADSKVWKLDGVIKRAANAASTVLLGTPTVTIIAEDAGATTWNVAVTADTTNGSLKIEITGGAYEVRWGGVIRTMEVGY